MAASRGHRFQFLNFCGAQPSEFSRRNIQAQRAITHALDLLYVMPDFLEHAPNLTVLAFHQRELIPGIVSLADDANFRGGGMNASATSIRPLLPGRFGFGIRNAFRLRAFIIPQAFGRAESVRRNCQSPPES